MKIYFGTAWSTKFKPFCVSYLILTEKEKFTGLKLGTGITLNMT